ERSERALELGLAEPATSLTCHVVSVSHLVYRRRQMWRWLPLGLLAMLAACPPPEPPAAPIPPVSTGKVRVRVFTEPSAVKQIAAIGKFTFVGTDDTLERWDDKGDLVAMSA